jgi:hypothetical protein
MEPIRLMATGQVCGEVICDHHGVFLAAFFCCLGSIRLKLVSCGKSSTVWMWLNLWLEWWVFRLNQTHKWHIGLPPVLYLEWCKTSPWTIGSDDYSKSSWYYWLLCPHCYIQLQRSRLKTGWSKIEVHLSWHNGIRVLVYLNSTLCQKTLL